MILINIEIVLYLQIFVGNSLPATTHHSELPIPNQISLSGFVAMQQSQQQLPMFNRLNIM